MSRVGKKPIPVPEKTKITYSQGVLTVEGPKGTLTRRIHPKVELDIGDEQVAVTVDRSDKTTKALWGTTRAQVANMIAGVSSGFERVLEIYGIGYRAELKGRNIELHLGYSHPINFELPEGIDAAVDKATIRLSGIDKELLGFTASSIRKMRPPEPYKGKGVKYAEELVQRKAGKTAK
ncbi:MAG: 50S ribosomal protein L6 [Desulfobacteraceae bacterium]|nr:50S ribosomal protein L6 [Desulfobacteraceae bacterium]MCF8093876.1 50S ribosomal protein L6 [Desulfobacteraceae bacterium]